jgi:carboxyl-terminal processing protease
MNFEDGSAVRLTIARYYTPTADRFKTLYKEMMKLILRNQKRFASGVYEKDSMGCRQFKV